MIWMLLGVASSGYAQKTKKVHGEYIMPSSRLEPLKQASRNTTISFALVEPNSV